VTGGSGNLGSRLVPAIHNLSNECAILLRPSSVVNDEIISLKNLFTYRPLSQAEIYNLIRLFDPDIVVHAACHYGLNGAQDSEISRTNIDLGLAIIEALNARGTVKTFININTALPSEVSIYAKSKHEFSFICQQIEKKYSGKFRFIDLTTQTIYGGSTQAGFVSYIIRECLKDGGDLKLTSGHQKRDFIYIDDVVCAVNKIILNTQNNKLESQYDLGSGVSRSIRDVVTLIHRLSKSKVKLLFGALPNRAKEPMNLVADTAKLRTLGWAPSINFEEKIKEMLLREMDSARTTY
jgi:nucleoside-diphosphate-sugar epimerase